MTRTIWNTLATLAVLIFTALPLSAAEVVTYYHNDHLGSPIAATDDTGTVVWQQAYDPWGFKLTANTDERGYTGNWLDEETGLADHKARWYTSSIGRFTGIDPVKWHETNIHSFNRYSYSGNNPYTNTDVGGKLFFSFHMNRRDMSTEHAMIASQVGNVGAKTAMSLHTAGSAVSAVGGAARLLLKAGMKEAIKGLPSSANFAQTTFRSQFSATGRRELSAIAGQPIRTVDDLSNAIRGGLDPSKIPVNVIERGGNTLILNTRTVKALEQAGVPRSSFNVINRTGDELFERLLSGQLRRNNLSNRGVSSAVQE